MHSFNGLFYKGYYYDKETNLYYLITRYYDPEVGRFISADDPKYLDFQVAYGYNRYAYCNNNPVMGYDPEGNFWWKIIAAVAVVAVLVVASICTAGTAAGVVLAGAAVGATVGGAVSGVTKGVEAVEKGESFLEGLADGVLEGSLSGAVSGAVAASPLNVFGQVATNMVISAGMYALTTEDFSHEELAGAALVGGVAGLVGGNGSMHIEKGLTQAGQNILSKFKMELFQEIKSDLLGQVIYPITKSATAGLSVTVIEKIHS